MTKPHFLNIWIFLSLRYIDRSLYFVRSWNTCIPNISKIRRIKVQNFIVSALYKYVCTYFGNFLGIFNHLFVPKQNKYLTSLSPHTYTIEYGRARASVVVECYSIRVVLRTMNIKLACLFEYVFSKLYFHIYRYYNSIINTKKSCYYFYCCFVLVVSLIFQ